jgi:hypothetical protein
VTGQKWSGEHRRLSEQMRARALGQLCHFCGLPMLPGQPLDLDHADDGIRYRGVAHRRCNRVDGGRKSLAIQRARRQQRRRRFTVPTEGCLGVEIAVDRSHTAVVHAGRGRDGRVVVELRAYFDGTNVAAAIADMIRQWSPGITATLLDPRSPAATLLEPLQALRVDVTEASTHVVSAADNPGALVRPGADCCLLGLTYPRMWSGDVTGEHGRDLRAAFGGHLRVSIP